MENALCSVKVERQLDFTCSYRFFPDLLREDSTIIIIIASIYTMEMKKTFIRIGVWVSAVHCATYECNCVAYKGRY